VPPTFSPYQKRLFAFLSVASFFEGYDFFAISQLLTSIRATFGLTPQQGTWLITLINFGTILAYLLVRRADRWGRKRVLSVTIAGYALFRSSASSAHRLGSAQSCAPAWCRCC
jgi:putative MFS transporter